MLNKGPYLLDAIDQLRALLQRMENNQHKKTPQLRRLKSW
jgi:pyruvate kinase